MKNKEIEELLKYLKNKFYISGEFYAEEKIKVLSKKELELLSSYIEQLEKENEKANKYIDFYKDLTEKQNKSLEEFKQEKKQLQNNRDKAIEILNKWEKENINPVFRKGLLKILKGGSDDK